MVNLGWRSLLFAEGGGRRREEDEEGRESEEENGGGWAHLQTGHLWVLARQSLQISRLQQGVIVPPQGRRVAAKRHPTHMELLDMVVKKQEWKNKKE